ncbi:MAG: DUF481 domain-containing protein [Pseudomonadales bacterium]|nr:DUF481 domain-containing protein [Halioglobus sp.]MCP5130983.1 DUF481 domain-containing protein [Pseudomonadales bacterium]
MNLRKHFALVFALLFLPGADVLAHPKTDTVILYNGDRITGEIKELDGGILKLGTDSMGTISIEWQEIARIDSKYYYEFQLSNGARHFGSVEKPSRPGQLIVAELGQDMEIEWLDLVRMRPIESKVIDRIDAYFSAGYAYTRANSLAQTSFNGNVSYENEKGRNTLDGRVNLTDSDDDSTSSSKIELNRAVWTKRPGVFSATFGTYEQNDELDLNYRLGVGMGIGRFFLDTYRNRLSGMAGLQVITEDNKSEGTDENLELALTSRYEAWRFNTPELNLDFGFSLYPSLTQSGRVRSSSDLNLRWELIEDLFFDITAYGTYDNRAEGDSGVDYGVTTGLGYDF